jgi:hypothetical protein
MTGENGPPPEGWTVTPRCCPFPQCHVCTPDEPHGYGTYPIPEHLELGEN